MHLIIIVNYNNYLNIHFKLIKEVDIFKYLVILVEFYGIAILPTTYLNISEYQVQEKKKEYYSDFNYKVI